jgi:hypothetical protein
MLVSELDVTKEKIAYLKVWLGILVVTDISLVGWFVSNIASANTVALVASVAAVVAVTAGIFILHKRIDRYIRSLKDL